MPVVTKAQISARAPVPLVPIDDLVFKSSLLVNGATRRARCKFLVCNERILLSILRSIYFQDGRAGCAGQLVWVQFNRSKVICLSGISQITFARLRRCHTGITSPLIRAPISSRAIARINYPLPIIRTGNMIF